VLFAEGRFHARERVSDDGQSWQAAPGRSPLAYLADHFVEDAGAHLERYGSEGERERLRLVRPSIRAALEPYRNNVGRLDRDQPIPDTVEVPFEDGLTCEM
jgi:hypothetical protein